MVYIAPSVLSANFLDLKTELNSIVATNQIKYLHYDVMDGCFVNNLSFGPDILGQIKSHTQDALILDVHLMVDTPDKYFDVMAQKGADIITFHLEGYDNEANVHNAIKNIKALNCRAGISIKPATPVESLKPFLEELDLVLVMSVEPGFGGQSFMPDMLEKIVDLDTMRKQHNFSYVIEVDGGINQETFSLVKNAGVDIAVLGSYFFNQEDYEVLMEQLLAV